MSAGRSSALGPRLAHRLGRRHAAGPRTSSRIVGVDVARALALLAMMSVHILPEFDSRGRVTATFVVAAGRASALFALLAGTGLALATGGRHPRLRPWRATAAGVLTRAGIVALVGLLLGQLSPPVAVILTNYGLLFVLGLAVLTMAPRWLFALAAAVVVTSPLLSHALRVTLPPGPGAQPSLSGLGHPVELLRTLTLTGYYPVLQWSAYLLVGMATGRLALDHRRPAATLLTVGAALAVGSRLLSDQLLERGGLGALRAAGPAELVPGGPTSTAVARLQLLGRYGVPPTTTWWWQAVAAPHTGTPFDLAHTIGSSLAVLGLVLLLIQAVAWAVQWDRLPRAGTALLTWPVAVLAATGSMTLTLYSLHVLALVARLGPQDRPLLLGTHVAVAVAAASGWLAVYRRGPLEAVVARAAAAARRRVTPA